MFPTLLDCADLCCVDVSTDFFFFFFFVSYLSKAYCDIYIDLWHTLLKNMRLWLTKFEYIWYDTSSGWLLKCWVHMSKKDSFTKTRLLKNTEKFSTKK